MLTSITKKIKAVPSYFYRNYAAPKVYSIRDRKILAKNLELKDKYIGRRCFIIGAGPSIADTDLSRLKQEHTFVVNEFENNKQSRSLTPTFHIISESNYFTENGPEYWQGRFKEKSRIVSKDTTMIINLKAIPFVNKYGLFKQHKVYYTGTQGVFSNNLPFNIGLDRYVPYPKNSILMCIIAAVWMGFDKIYLLGCEHNFLAKPVGRSQTLGFSHSYEDETSHLDTADDNVLKKYLDLKTLGFNYEENIAQILQLFKNYRLFYKKVKQLYPDTKIFNATPNSFLDVFPMIKFEEIKGLL